MIRRGPLLLRRKGSLRIYQIVLGILGVVVLCTRFFLLHAVVAPSQDYHFDHLRSDAFFVEALDKNKTTRCYTDECIDALGSKLARVWRPHYHRLWCGAALTTAATTRTSTDNNSSNPLLPLDANSTGLWLIKVPKSASSTVAGLVLRIAELHQCPVRWQHAKAVDVLASLSSQQQQQQQNHDHHNIINSNEEGQLFQKKNRTAFVVAPIRNPRSRALSSVYYHTVSLQARPNAAGQQQQQAASDAHVLRQLERDMDDYITDYTRVSPAVEKHEDEEPPWRVVREILETYSFLLVVEEMEASLVVFAWLADLALSNVLIMSSKTAGSWYATGKRGKCVPLIPPQVTPAVEAYWTNGPGRTRHYTDRLLHSAAQHSLHRTINEGMGKDLFNQQLEKFLALQAYTQEKCGAAMNESAPCSPTGEHQPEISKEACYLRDFGCGHHCLEELFPRQQL